MKYSVLTQQDVGLLVSSEASFETKTLPLLKADTVPTDGIADIVSLKKGWLACQGAVDREASTAAGRIQLVEFNCPQSATEKTKISEAWSCYSTQTQHLSHGNTTGAVLHCSESQSIL